jgi:hypothetical protein
MTLKVPNKVTPKLLDDYFEAVAQTGNLTEAAKIVKIDSSTFRRLRQRDKEFAKRLEEARTAGVESLEDEARRRAHDGWEEPVYQKGEHVGVIRKYSDTLLIFLLKGAKPEKYRDNVTSKVDGNVNVTFRWKTDDDGDNNPVQAA